jgi:hypothetical protein
VIDLFIFLWSEGCGFGQAHAVWPNGHGGFGHFVSISEIMGDRVGELSVWYYM